MNRKLPRSFFWVDQQLIRGGAWLKLSAPARLAYIALAASCDRQGVSIWSRHKLMELSACQDPDDWGSTLVELESHQLIQLLPECAPPEIRLTELTAESPASSGAEFKSPPGTPAAAMAGPSPWASSGPLVVHTQTTIHLGHTPREEKLVHADPRKSD